MATDMAEDEVYQIVRRGVRDAIWDVLEVVITIGVAIVVFFIGLGLLRIGAAQLGSVPGLASLVVGGVLVLAAVFKVLKQFQLGPYR